MLDISLLGGLRLVHDGVVLRLASARLQSLLGHLTLHRRKAVPRAYLAGLLWADSSPAQSLTNLRQLLHDLRCELPGADRFVDFGGQEVRWREDAPYTLDVADFESAVAEGSPRSLRAAVEMYAGDLLPGCYDEWILPERERLRQAYHGAQERLADWLEKAGEHEEAALHARRLLMHDPLREETHRQLMRLCALRGDGSGVVRAYRDCAAVLRDELGVEPSPPTRDLFERLRATAPEPGGGCVRTAHAAPARGDPCEAPAVPGQAETMGTVLDAREDALFVGREEHRVRFREWLDARAPVPELLNVHGPGGVGKSALLRCFAKTARTLGREVVLADGRAFPPTAEGLLAALAPVPPGEAVAYLNRVCPVVLLDGCDELGALNRYLLDDLLPKLATGVRVVITGRLPVARVWDVDSPWCRIVRSLPLDGFTAAEIREYLRRRGLTDPDLAGRVLAATAGSPLAVSLAADILLQTGVSDLRSAPQWRLAMRGLVDRLLREVEDPERIGLIEACSVVRQFDQPMLAALSGKADVGPAFGQLCRLSVVRPAERGLALHDGVRRLLAEDLRWRDPQRHADLRLRAVAHCGRLMRGAPPAERERLATECLFLWGDALPHELMFHPAPPGEVWTEPVWPEDNGDVRRIWDRRAGRPGPNADHDASRAGLEAVLAYSHARLRIARGPGGRALGFSATVPVCRESLSILAASPDTAALACSRWNGANGAALPETAGGATAFVFRHLVQVDDGEAAVRTQLVCDTLSLLAHGGRYYLPAPPPAVRELAEALGFRRVDAASGGGRLADVYELDLTQTGFVAWIDGLMRGRPPVQAPAGTELESELQAVLTHWRDDARLARLRLAGLVPDSSPADLRQNVLSALQRARSRAGEGEGLMLRSLSLAFLQPGDVSPEEAAARLGVSRATFYRQVKRGIRALAAAIEEEWRR